MRSAAFAGVEGGSGAETNAADDIGWVCDTDEAGEVGDAAEASVYVVAICSEANECVTTLK